MFEIFFVKEGGHGMFFFALFLGSGLARKVLAYLLYQPMLLLQLPCCLLAKPSTHNTPLHVAEKPVNAAFIDRNVVGPAGLNVLKGIVWEETAWLAALMVALAPFRAAFVRQARLTRMEITPGAPGPCPPPPRRPW